MLRNMPDNKVVKQVFNCLNSCHATHFGTWCTQVYELATYYAIDFQCTDISVFKNLCKEVGENKFENVWVSNINNIEVHIKLRA